MCGSLGDLIGRQKILIISAFWLLAFSIACAAAPTYAWMVFFRLCVGMGMVRAGAEPLGVKCCRTVAVRSPPLGKA